MSDAVDILGIVEPIGELFVKALIDAFTNRDKPAVERLMAGMKSSEKMDAEDKLLIIQLTDQAHALIESRQPAPAP